MRLMTILPAALAVLSLAGCDLIGGGIFKAGSWVGMLAVVAVIVLILLVVSSFRR
jgi:hypothetical protein